MSSKNPFSAFAAGGGDGDGWLTTKRKGKDDVQIQRDSALALAARKNAKKSKQPSQKKKAPKRKKPRRKSSIYDSEDEDLSDFIANDDEEIEEEPASDFSDDEEVVPMRKRSKQKPSKKKKAETIDLLTSPEEVEQKKRSALYDASNRRRYSEEKKEEDGYSSSSSDSELEIITGGKPTFSSHFQQKKQSSVLAAVARKPSGQDSSSDDDDVTPFKPNKKKRSFKSASLHDSSDEDDFFRNSYGSSAGITHNDFANDDETTAIAHALEASSNPERKRLKKKKKKATKRQVTVALSPDRSPKSSSSPADDEADVIMLEESSSSEGEEDEQDAYVDKGAREAVSVLKAANDLSAKVIQAMTGWSAKDNDTESLPAGIIVDGALSLVSSDSSHTSSHSWISQEVMQKACPKVKLADYQLIGVNWLALLHNLKCEVDGKKGGTNVNGVLADEMGLGKTVQTIAFLAWLRYSKGIKVEPQEPQVIDLDGESESEEKEVVMLDDDDDKKTENGDNTDESTYVRPHLIVVPASTLTNWEREFEKFCPHLHVIKYHGSMMEREELREQLRKYLPRRGEDAKPNAFRVDVILTTFSYFSGEKTDDRAFLKRFDFDYLVVDEAHCLKNARGQRYRNLDKVQTSHRLLLTGTPVQNSPKELMSLLSFLMPLFSKSSGGGFDDDEETKNDGGESMLQHFVSIEASDMSKDEANEAAYKKLKQLFAPFVLRRQKAQALKQLLPEKTRIVEWVPFDDATRAVYDSVLAKHVDKKMNPSAMSATAQQHLFTALRKAANHPLLLRNRHTSEEEKHQLATLLYQYGYFGRDETCTLDHVKQALDKMSDFDVHCAALDLIAENKCRQTELGRYTLQQEDLFSSPKFERLRVLLPELIEDGHRILIFSQWKICLDLIGCLMESLNLEFLRLDGDTKIAERQDLIDTFNQDMSIPVFLLSTRAGGMGINLTAADTCILHDLDFNPFNDIQSEDRCHRIGQTKPVTVIKMVTKDTVDEDIYKMQERKAKMNAAILESGSGSTDQETKQEEEAAKQSIIQSAVNRFVASPFVSNASRSAQQEDDEEEDGEDI